MTARRKHADPKRSQAIKDGMKRGQHGRGEHTEFDEACPTCVAERGDVSIPGVVGTPEKSDEVKDREHQAALAEAAKADAEASVPIPVIGDENPDIVLHVLVDGFTVLSKVWYRGEEIRIVRGSDTWALTVDRYGKSWVDMTEADQIEHYKKVMFALGPWPFPRPQEAKESDIEDAYMKALNSGDREALRRYEKAQQRAGRPKVATGS
jgi:hypothetical protein